METLAERTGYPDLRDVEKPRELEQFSLTSIVRGGGYVLREGCNAFARGMRQIYLNISDYKELR